MGKMFHALGLLPGDELHEAKASDLVTGYTGQAGKCTREVLRKSLGGVLFIDEAYQLDPARGGSYMAEAADELVGAVTEDEFKGKILVILAGYDVDMENMLKTNPGLKSRFSERVHFNDFDADSIRDLLLIELKKADIPLCNADMEEMMGLCERFINESGDSFGNGRDVVTWARKVYNVVAGKFSRGAPSSVEFDFSSSMGDVKIALDQILDSRIVKEGGQICASIDRSMDKPQGANAAMSKAPPPLMQTIQAVQDIECVPDSDDELKPSSNKDELPSNIFESLDSDVLKSLQTYINEHGLGTEEGAKHLAAIDPNSQEFYDLATQLANRYEHLIC